MLTCSRLLIAFSFAVVAALSFGQSATSPLSSGSQQPSTSESTDCAFGGAGCASSSEGLSDSLDLSGTTPSVPGVGVPSAGSMLGGSVYTDNAGGVGGGEERRPPRMSAAPAPLTEFQMLVAGSIGRIVPIYGADLFVNVPDTFAPVMHIPVTPDYVIAPGDQLLIRTWGQVNLNLHLVVDRSGSVYIPQIGEVRVAGLQFGQLEGFLKSQFAPVYRNFDLNVNLGQLHSIQVFVTGQARRPGSYTISSLSTLVNAIFACGGPQPHGSLRHIQLRRGANQIADFDLYDLLLHGDKSKDVPLETGDVIYFPPAGAEVAVVGSVFQPAIYEMRDKETIADALALAGGASAVSDQSSLEVERSEIQPNGASARVAVDVSMTSSSLASPVETADIIRVRSRAPRFDKTVTLRGNVANPGRYAWHEGMRIHDLLPDKDALLTPGYWLRRENLGLPVTDYQPLLPPIRQAETAGGTRNRSRVVPEDVQTLGSGLFPQLTKGVPAETSPAQSNSGQYSSLAASTDNSREPGSSASGKPSQAPATPAGESLATLGTGPRLVTAPQFPIETQVVKTSPDIDWNYAVVERVDRSTLSTKLIPFSLAKAVNEREADADVELNPGDVVTVFSEADIRLPREQQTKYVRLEGEIVHAGVYSVLPGETLRHLVIRAGGLTPQAYLYGSQLTRESTQREQQQRLDEYVAALAYEIEAAASNRSTSVVSATEALTTNASMASQRELVNSLRQARATGRIVLHIPPSHAAIDSIPDMPLEDGDRFIVPPVPSTVGIVGAVYDPNSFVFQAHRDAGEYLRNAGGPNRNADRRQIFIIHADGTVISKQSISHNLWSSDQFDREPIYPGDTIVVPEAINKSSVLRGLTDWSAVFSQFALGAAAIQVIK